jgi:hypothetical protein
MANLAAMPHNDLSRLNHSQNAIVAFSVAGIFAALAHFTLEVHWGYYWPIPPIGGLLLFIYLSIDELWSRRLHRGIAIDRRLKCLLAQGFTEERIGDYHGLRGEHRGYFARIFVNPESRLHRRDRELTIMVYFEPPKDHHDKLDTRLLDRINEELAPGFFSGRMTLLRVEASSVIHHTPFTPFISCKRINRRLDKAVDTALRFGLHPIPEARVHELVTESAWLHGPDIDVFQELYAKR